MLKNNNIKYFFRKEKKRLYLFIQREKRFLRKKRMTIYPTTIQFPITYLCNFDCVMCGMRKLIHEKDMSLVNLEIVMKDPIFQRVTNVGINGGEPFLKGDLVEAISVMIENLPLLKSFYFITNGYLTEEILEKLSRIKSLCEEKNIKIYLSISVDGYGDMQDFHRGHQDAFLHAEETLKDILDSKQSYVDGLDIICTITKYNIERINEVEVWAEHLGVDVAYNIATVNARIANEDKDFSVFSDEHARMLAEEFFYTKYRETKNEKYYAIYYLLKTKERVADCPCMWNEWLTLLPDGQIGFCATHSKILGSLLEKSGEQIVRQELKYHKEMKKKYCKNCSHYSYTLNKKGLKSMHEDFLTCNYLR